MRVVFLVLAFVFAAGMSLGFMRPTRQLSAPARAAQCLNLPKTVQRSMRAHFPQNAKLATLIILNSKSTLVVRVSHRTQKCTISNERVIVPVPPIELLDQVRAASVPDYAHANDNHFPVYVLMELPSTGSDETLFVATVAFFPFSQETARVA